MRGRTLIGLAVLGCVVFIGANAAQALTTLEKLGGLIYRDTNLSINNNQACMTCHHPSAGFEDPANRRDPVNFPVSEGSIAGLFGGRNAPTAAYAGFSPKLSQDATGAWSGGMFWDGRATGWSTTLGDPLAEQAQGPFTNPVEMALPNPAEVVARVKAAPYANLFRTLRMDITFDNIARAIAAFERSTSVTRFTSKFDQFWQACQAAGIEVSAINESTNLSTLPQGILTTRQLQGLALFNGKAKCSACHLTTNHVDASGNPYPPLFTDFTYDNLGIPTNQTVYNLAGGVPPDPGLGGFLKSKGIAGFENEWGKFKVPTLRNVAKSPPYGHNGYFPTLAKIVNFYNTRDVGSWPGPEVPENVNSEDLGNLGLSPAEEQSLVVFMQALNDEGQ